LNGLREDFPKYNNAQSALNSVRSKLCGASVNIRGVFLGLKKSVLIIKLNGLELCDLWLKTNPFLVLAFIMMVWRRFFGGSNIFNLVQIFDEHWASSQDGVFYICLYEFLCTLKTCCWCGMDFGVL